MPSVQKAKPEPSLFEDGALANVPVLPVEKPVKAASARIELPKTDKAPNAYRTISEVAADLDVPQHVLRFWETRFPQLKPLKRGGGRRYYRAEDITLLRQIHTMLYGEGYTIKGAQKLLATAPAKAKKAVEKPVLVVKEAAASREVLLGLLKELRELRALV